MIDKYIKRIKSTEYEYIPVVLGNNANALGIVRSLGEKNIPVIVADYEIGIAFYSKYAIPYKIGNGIKNDDNFIESLFSLAVTLNKLNKKGLLFCSTDTYLFSVGEKYDTLSEKYKIMMGNWSSVKLCLDKSYLYKEAERLKIPCPKTFVAKNVKEVINGTYILEYPILIKPAVTVGFSEVYRKAIIVENNKQLLTIQNEINNLGLGNHGLIMQELIPGPITNLYTFSSYSNTFGEVKAYSIGHKIRQTPPETGTITSGKVVDNDALARLGKEFIKGLKFHGIANTEFKLDERDGTFKLIEINPRPGLWNYSATAAGVNLSWIAYENVALKRDEPIISATKELIWIYDFMDISRAVVSNKYGHDKYRINLLEWWRSVKGKRIYAIWQLRDPMPLFWFILGSIIKKANKLSRIIKQRRK